MVKLKARQHGDGSPKGGQGMAASGIEHDHVASKVREPGNIRAAALSKDRRWRELWVAQLFTHEQVDRPLETSSIAIP
jgi:hypothetical protein